MANSVYENFYLANEVEDQFASHLDLATFCKTEILPDGEAGMTKKINVYKATDGTEKLAQGVGNTSTIEVSHTSKDYEILLAQNRFSYYDEEAMADPMLVVTGTKHAGTDIFNKANADIFAEYGKATLSVSASAFNFAAFVDASAKLDVENLEGTSVFAFISPEDMAKLRKALNEDLRYVESFARQGYVGTVAGINVYVKKDATAGTAIVATKDAVTLFTKKGTEIEQERNGNIRQNTIYSRKYYLAALTDETKVVKIVVA